MEYRTSGGFCQYVEPIKYKAGSDGGRFLEVFLVLFPYQVKTAVGKEEEFEGGHSDLWGLIGGSVFRIYP